MKKVLLVIASNGFQPREYSAPKKVLLENGIEVTTASDRIGRATPSFGNENVNVDVALANTKASDYDGIFFIGGPGALSCLDNETSYQLVRDASALGKIVGAICISPRILAKAGILKNKKATGWNDDHNLENIFSTSEAVYMKEGVVVDNNIITANGPKAAEEFGKKILDMLQV